MTATQEPTFVLMSHKWNRNVFTNLAILRDEGVLCDVTLQGNDDKQLLAHSSVLAAASSVLKSCLVQAPRGHYVVKIPSISSIIWEILLSFIYTGKVRVTFQHKNEIVSATQTLGLSELNGLCSAVYEPTPAPKPDPSTANARDLMDSEAATSSTEITIMNEDAVNETVAFNTALDRVPLQQPTDENAATDSKNKYTCGTCGKSFPWGRTLLVHEMMHKEKKGPRHQCSKCEKSFNTFHSLRAHERTHRYLPFKCDLCSQGFHFRVNYELHRKKVHGIGDDIVFRCEYCDKEFMAVGLLNRHQATVHKIQKQNQVKSESRGSLADVGGKCVECNLDFDNRQSLSEHFKSLHKSEKKEVKCSECGDTFKSIIALKEHFSIHTGEPFERPYKCQHCDKRYLYRYAVTAHEKEAHMLSPQVCLVCGAQVKSERVLVKHMKLHEGQMGEGTWKCDICDAVFTDRPTYVLHMAEHRGDKTYYCKYCSKGFPHKGNYSTHMQRHLGIKPFSCKWCSKTFVRKDDMKSHLRVHTGEKPFSCQVCNMKFAGVSNLREHERAKHNVSFSKRNPVTTPRQHRTKQHRGCKTVAHVDITQEGALADLADAVTGVLNTSTDSPAELVIEQQISSINREGSSEQPMTVVQNSDGTYTQLVRQGQEIETEQAYDLYNMGSGSTYQVVMDTGSQNIKPLFHDKSYPDEHNEAAQTVQVQNIATDN